jgi:hypothetical protein
MLRDIVNYLIDTGLIPGRPFKEPYSLTYDESRWAHSRAMEMKAEGSIPSDVLVTAFWSEKDGRIVLQDVSNPENTYYP